LKASVPSSRQGGRKTIAGARSKNTLGPKRALQNLLLQQNRPRADIASPVLLYRTNAGLFSADCVVR
jgi:hypothetical protein